MRAPRAASINVEASQLLPEIRPRWWPALAGTGFAALIVAIAMLLPINASFTGEAETTSEGTCVFQGRDDQPDPTATLDASGMEVTHMDEHIEVHGCEPSSIDQGTVVQVETTTSLAQLLSDLTVGSGGTQ